MNRQPVLTGERLLLRPLRPDDWAALYAVASDPELWTLHPAHDRWQESVFRAFFEDALSGGGAIAVIERSSGAIIGTSRWQRHDPADGGSVEIGWTFLARSHWGGRTNAELKRLMLAHALAEVAVVHFRVGEGNLRSRRAMEKIGARLTDQIELVQLPGGAVVHVIYAITGRDFATGPLSGPISPAGSASA